MKQNMTVIDTFILSSVQAHPNDLVEYVVAQTGLTKRRISTLVNELIRSGSIKKGYVLPVTPVEHSPSYTTSPAGTKLIDLSQLLDLDDEA